MKKKLLIKKQKKVIKIHYLKIILSIKGIKISEKKFKIFKILLKSLFSRK
jgi:hypothetical protein